MSTAIYVFTVLSKSDLPLKEISTRELKARVENSRFVKRKTTNGGRVDDFEDLPLGVGSLLSLVQEQSVTGQSMNSAPRELQ